MREIQQISGLCIFVSLLLLCAQVDLSSSAVSSCHALLTGSSGTFTSPNYPGTPALSTNAVASSSYPENGGFVTCKWEIVVPPDKGIQLKFGDFNIEGPTDDCDWGEVEVFNGIGKHKNSLDQYCAGNTPDTVTLKNNSATVLFRRPSNFKGKGFLISYIATAPSQTMHDFITCSEVISHLDLKSFSAVCPSGCASIQSHKVWGSLKYRENSHICRAAVHAGVISDEFGGRILVQKKLSGVVLFAGALANNVTSEIGDMSKSQIIFPALEICHNVIPISKDDFSASSFCNTTKSDGKIREWLPKKAILTSDTEAWAPDDPTKVQWLQVDLGKVTNITGILTKGSSKPVYSYTKSFTVMYSNNSKWHFYKESGHRKPKVFAGNVNFFEEVRNNFVKPSIIARYIRVYPTPKKADDEFYALKLGILGCELKNPDPSTLSTASSVLATSPHSSHFTTYQQPINVTSLDNKNNKRTDTTTPGLDIQSTTNHSTVPFNVKDQNPNEPDTKNTNSDEGVSERSIIIIAIVTALAVTSILLSALVLLLVRKRKKVPKLDIILNKQNSQLNQTYNDTVGMHYLNYNNNPNRKKFKTRDKTPGSQNIEYKNVNYKDSFVPNAENVANERSDVTMQYDHNTIGSGVHGKNSTRLPNASFLTNGGGPSLQHADIETGSFTSDDDDDHEYQVIPDPINEYNPQGNHFSSNPSTRSSTGARSKSSDTPSWQHVANPGTQLWGTAGDAWSKQAGSDKASLSSFTPRNKYRPSQSSRAGTFPHQVHHSIPDEAEDPLIGPQSGPPCASFTAPRFSHGKRNGSQSPSNSSMTGALRGFSPVRYSSSSSAGSSSQAPFEVTSPKYHDPSAAYYSSVPAEEDSSFPSMSSQHQQPLSPPSQFVTPHRKPSYKFPSSNPVDAFTFPGNGGVLATQPNENGSTKGIQNSSLRSNSVNHSKSRGSYDHLYRNKSVTGADHGKCLVASLSNYNQLDLNTAV